MKRYLLHLFVALISTVPLPGYCEDLDYRREGTTEWISARPLAVSTAAFESPSNIHCYMGIAYEVNGSRGVGAAMTRHCLNLVAVAALVRAEIADADSKGIRIAIVPDAADYYRRISHILVNGIDYDLSE